MVNDRTLAILGASGHGKVVADIALQSGWSHVVFYDDAWPEKSKIEHWDILGNQESLLRNLDCYGGVVVAIGNNPTRSTILETLLDKKAKLATLIHPCSIVSPLAIVEAGCVIVAGAVVNAFAYISLGGIVNTNATVGHDCRIGRCAHIAPGANVAGDVIIGHCSWIGVGSTIRQCIKIGEKVVIGAGSVVVSDIQSNTTVIGSPARPIDFFESPILDIDRTL